jgi:hypothetical protein
VADSDSAQGRRLGEDGTPVAVYLAAAVTKLGVVSREAAVRSAPRLDTVDLEACGGLANGGQPQPYQRPDSDRFPFKIRLAGNGSVGERWVGGRTSPDACEEKTTERGGAGEYQERQLHDHSGQPASGEPRGRLGPDLHRLIVPHRTALLLVASRE